MFHATVITCSILWLSALEMFHAMPNATRHDAWRHHPQGLDQWMRVVAKKILTKKIWDYIYLSLRSPWLQDLIQVVQAVVGDTCSETIWFYILLPLIWNSLPILSWFEILPDLKSFPDSKTALPISFKFFLQIHDLQSNELSRFCEVCALCFFAFDCGMVCGQHPFCIFFQISLHVCEAILLFKIILHRKRILLAC